MIDKDQENQRQVQQISSQHPRNRTSPRFPGKITLQTEARQIEFEYDAGRNFDKAMLTLATGSLALSITFLEKIATDTWWWSLPMLAVSWGAFVL